MDDSEKAQIRACYERRSRLIRSDVTDSFRGKINVKNMIERDYGQDPHFIEGRWQFAGARTGLVRSIRVLVVARCRLSDRVFLGVMDGAVTIVVEAVGTEWVDVGVVEGIRLGLIPTTERILVRLPVGTVCRVGDVLRFSTRLSRTTAWTTPPIRRIGYLPAETGFDRQPIDGSSRH